MNLKKKNLICSQGFSLKFIKCTGYNSVTTKQDLEHLGATKNIVGWLHLRTITVGLGDLIGLFQPM